MRATRKYAAGQIGQIWPMGQGLRAAELSVYETRREERRGGGEGGGGEGGGGGGGGGEGGGGEGGGGEGGGGEGGGGEGGGGEGGGGGGVVTHAVEGQGHQNTLYTGVRRHQSKLRAAVVNQVKLGVLASP